MTTTMAAPQPTSAFGFTFPLQQQFDYPDPNLPLPDQSSQPFDPSFGFDFGSFADNTFDITSFDAFKQFIQTDGHDGDNSLSNHSDTPSLAESTSSPSSDEIVSPKSTLSSFDEYAFAPAANNISFPCPVPAPVPLQAESQGNIDIEALSKHHFERFLHYKALADEAQRKADTNQAQVGAFQTLLAPIDMNATANTAPVASKPVDNGMLLSYAPIAPTAASAPRQATASFAYDPNMAQASMAQAQADAHFQAHTAAAAQIQQQRMHHHHNPTQYWVHSARSSFDGNVGSMSMSEPAWSRSSFSTAQSASPPYPGTPTYASGAMMPTQSAPPMQIQQHLPPSAPIPVPVQAPMQSEPVVPLMAPIPVPVPVTQSLPAVPTPLAADIVTGVAGPASMPMLHVSPSNSAGSAGSNSSLGSLSLRSKPILNPHGGGRGYVPGKTPDDPKKRHKCVVCGRGFARAFNLKSHMATHDPDRSKPHMCPHTSCKRGFSRLHDLERHRQGIHNDGPLVDAKLQGVTPSVARAQVRSNKSSSVSTTTSTSESSALLSSILTVPQ